MAEFDIQTGVATEQPGEVEKEVKVQGDVDNTQTSQDQELFTEYMMELMGGAGRQDTLPPNYHIQDMLHRE